MLDLETLCFFLSSRLVSAESCNQPDAVIPHQQGQTICGDQSNISGTGDLGQLWSPIVAGPEIRFANLGSLVSAEKVSQSSSFVRMLRGGLVRHPNSLDFCLPRIVSARIFFTNRFRGGKRVSSRVIRLVYCHNSWAGIQSNYGESDRRGMKDTSALMSNSICMVRASWKRHGRLLRETLYSYQNVRTVGKSTQSLSAQPGGVDYRGSACFKG